MATGSKEHGFANVIADDRNRNLLQHRGQGAALAQPAPARHRGVLADEQVVRAGQAQGGDVGLEHEGRVQAHQSQVELVREVVVPGVDHLPGGRALHVRERLLHRAEVVLAHPDTDLRRQQVVDAVTGSGDPVFVEQRSAAAMRRGEAEEGRPPD